MNGGNYGFQLGQTFGNYTPADNRSILEKAKSRLVELKAQIANAEAVKKEVAQLERMIAAGEAEQ